MQDHSAAQALLDAFGRILVINLPDRADRRRGIDAELRKAGLSLDHPQVHLFPAIRPEGPAGFPTIGAHGAFRSHMAVMERMLSEGWDTLLVLEDDMAFAPGAVARLPALAQALASRDWAMLYGHPGEEPASAPDAGGLIALPPDLGLIQLHFLGLTAQAARTALPELREMLTRPEGSPEGGPMHVDGALNWVRGKHHGLLALATAPAIATQRASRSDIAPPPWFDRVPVLRDLATTLRRWR
ncbi:MAG: hypothetical protein ACK4GT_06495 [Pararhodobacter sp.]